MLNITRSAKWNKKTERNMYIKGYFSYEASRTSLGTVKINKCHVIQTNTTGNVDILHLKLKGKCHCNRIKSSCVCHISR